MDVTSQPRLTADLQIREPEILIIQSLDHNGKTHVYVIKGLYNLPRNPLPPHTTILFFAADAICIVEM